MQYMILHGVVRGLKTFEPNKSLRGQSFQKLPEIHVEMNANGKKRLPGDFEGPESFDIVIMLYVSFALVKAKRKICGSRTVYL